MWYPYPNAHFTTQRPTPFPCPPSTHARAGKGQRAAKTEIEKASFGDKTVEEALGMVAKMCVCGCGCDGVALCGA